MNNQPFSVWLDLQKIIWVKFHENPPAIWPHVHTAWLKELMEELLVISFVFHTYTAAQA